MEKLEFYNYLNNHNTYLPRTNSLNPIQLTFLMRLINDEYLFRSSKGIGWDKQSGFSFIIEKKIFESIYKLSSDLYTMNEMLKSIKEIVNK